MCGFNFFKVIYSLKNKKVFFEEKKKFLEVINHFFDQIEVINH